MKPTTFFGWDERAVMAALCVVWVVAAVLIEVMARLMEAK